MEAEETFATATGVTFAGEERQQGGGREVNAAVYLLAISGEDASVQTRGGWRRGNGGGEQKEGGNEREEMVEPKDLFTWVISDLRWVSGTEDSQMKLKELR